MRLDALRRYNRTVMIGDLNPATEFTVRVRVARRIITRRSISKGLALAITKKKFARWLLLVGWVGTPGPERIASLHREESILRNRSSFSPGGAAINGNLQANFQGKLLERLQMFYSVRPTRNPLTALLEGDFP